MSQSILATFEDGVLKPHEPLHLLPHSQVRITVEPVQDAEQRLLQQRVWEDLRTLWRESTLDSGGDRLTRDQLHERR
jgi:predicted DNA-binding antitoxin AbrB/MazE fold protein